MFTGLIEALAPLRSLDANGPVWRLQLAVRWPDAEPTRLGDSIAVNGCCLTVVARDCEPDAELLDFELSPETLARTAFSLLHPGDPVNCERAAKLGQRMGGHLVTGHIDGVIDLVQITETAGFFDVHYAVPAELAAELVVKGSVAIDGVSLTVNALPVGQLHVTVIPHTVAHTQLLVGGAGKRAHIETDLIAKHVRRLVELGRAG